MSDIKKLISDDGAILPESQHLGLKDRAKDLKAYVYSKIETKEKFNFFALLKMAFSSSIKISTKSDTAIKFFSHLILKYYEDLSEKYRKMIPMKKVYIPVANDYD